MSMLRSGSGACPAKVQPRRERALPTRPTWQVPALAVLRGWLAQAAVLQIVNGAGVIDRSEAHTSHVTEAPGGPGGLAWKRAPGRTAGCRDRGSPIVYSGHCVCGSGSSCDGEHCREAHVKDGKGRTLHGFDPVKCPGCSCSPPHAHHDRGDWPQTVASIDERRWDANRGVKLKRRDGHFQRRRLPPTPNISHLPFGCKDWDHLEIKRYIGRGQHKHVSAVQ